MRKLGIDAGSTYLGVVLMEDQVVRETFYGEHQGNAAEALKGLLGEERFSRPDAVGAGEGRF